jgi:hypothetical protein
MPVSKRLNYQQLLYIPVRTGSLAKACEELLSYRFRFIRTTLSEIIR